MNWRNSAESFSSHLTFPPLLPHLPRPGAGWTWRRCCEHILYLSLCRCICIYVFVFVFVFFICICNRAGGSGYASNVGCSPKCQQRVKVILHCCLLTSQPSHQGVESNQKFAKYFKHLKRYFLHRNCVTEVTIC